MFLRQITFSILPGTGAEAMSRHKGHRWQLKSFVTHAATTAVLGLRGNRPVTDYPGHRESAKEGSPEWKCQSFERTKLWAKGQCCRNVSGCSWSLLSLPESQSTAGTSLVGLVPREQGTGCQQLQGLPRRDGLWSHWGSFLTASVFSQHLEKQTVSSLL